MRQIWTFSSPFEGKAFAWLDKLADPLQQAIQRILRRGPYGRQVKNWLHGTPLRHRLHPSVVTVPIGAWTAALLLDLLDSIRPASDTGYGKSADACVALGIAGALPSAASGLADWSDTADHPRRVGMAHALANSTALLLYIVSLFLRVTGRRTAARKVATVGYGSVLLGGVLGGELAYNLGIGVNYLLYPRPPQKFVDVLASSDLPEGQPVVVEVGRVPVLLLRRQGTIYAVQDWCTHVGGPLHAGALEGNTVRCPWHGSCFELGNGRPIDGPATAPLRTFEVREQAGRISVAPSYESQNWPPAPQPPRQEVRRVELG